MHDLMPQKTSQALSSGTEHITLREINEEREKIGEE